MAQYRLTELWWSDNPVRVVSVQVDDAVRGLIDVAPNNNLHKGLMGEAVWGVLLESGTVIELPQERDGKPIVPNPTWEPLDDDAREMVARHPRPQWYNTVDGLPQTLDMRDPLERIDSLEAAIGSMAQTMNKLIGALSPLADPPRLKLPSRG